MVKTIVFVSIIILFFFANEVYQTNMAHIRVWTSSEPKYTDPVSATLTHFSRSQTHFWPENWKLQIHITLSLMIGFWWNFIGMDPHMTPCCWPTFRDLDLLLQVKLEIDAIFFVFGLAKSRRRRIIPATWLDGYCQGPVRIEVWWRSVKHSLRYWILKFRPFLTKSAITRLVQMLEPPSFHQTGVFGNRRFNGAIQIFPGPTLVAMVTIIRPFSTQIGNNWACTNARAAEFAPNRGFSGSVDLMVLIKFSLDWPCCYGNEKSTIFDPNRP